MAEVADLSERREIKRLLGEVAALSRQLDQLRLEGDPALAQRVLGVEIVTLRDRHAFLLDRLRPALRGLLELNAATFSLTMPDATPTELLGLAAASLLFQGDELAEFGARIAVRRASLPDLLAAQTREWGPTLHDPPPEELK